MDFAALDMGMIKMRQPAATEGLLLMPMEIAGICRDVQCKMEVA